MQEYIGCDAHKKYSVFGARTRACRVPSGPGTRADALGPRGSQRQGIHTSVNAARTSRVRAPQLRGGPGSDHGRVCASLLPLRTDYGPLRVASKV